MANITDYSPNTENNNTQSFADLFFNGRVTDARNITGSVLRNTFKSIAIELGRYQTLLYEIITSYIPNFNDSFIEQWEKELGIPDDIFDNTGTNTERRRNIIIKLAYMNLQTEQDYIDLANLLNLSISISNSGFTTTIDIAGLTEPEFPYTFTMTFGTDVSGLFQQIVLKQKPAYQEVVFI